MKDYLRNLFAARGAAFWLNLLGLSLAFVIFYVLMAEVMWHVTFDRFHKDAGRVCQVFYEDISLEEWEKLEPSSDMEKKNFPAAFAEEVRRSTQDFEASVVVVNGYYSSLIPTDVEGVADSIETPFVEATEGLFKVFTFDLIEGDTAAIHAPNNVFIPLSLARKLFGESDSYVGRRCGEKDKWEAYVGGVYRDFPTNSQLDNVMYRNFSRERWDRFMGNNWDVNLFVKLRKGVDGEKLSDNLLANSIMIRNEAAHFTFHPIHDVYFMNIDEKTHLGETFRRHGDNYGN